ncbi:ribosome recycling factor [Clostridium grantii]|uniref:Ribosome-recycling factor n=1 Tax=Clostridium grantii DSM 8605 TaxID=1121316 RepID=A0A1M5QX39_9CLOT|nr:ribosome recycling factor [Clostridium grantii]SHH18320.1 ribosome recycling factor [Clostridium grantii DSM 8605]
MIKEIINHTEEKMGKSLVALKNELATLKAGKANPTMLDKISIEYYGAETPIGQIAGISVPEPRILMIQPWDKAALKDIERAILMSDLGINPSNDGISIRLIIPELTEETRKDIVKKVRKYGEETKVAVRGIRRDSNEKIKHLKKDGEINEDEEKLGEKDIQKITDKYVQKIDGVVENKEKEIMSV